ncbi:MAG: 50S ribosomal protein L6 [Eubacteriales bacterium]|nr:50S ribosomal protein L6 [Eubacteriales bacterium]
MSRIGKMPIAVPAGVEIKVDEKNGITVKGKNGTLASHVHKDMKINIDNGVLTVTRPSESKLHKSLHGLTRTLVNNMVVGVTQGFEKGLEINGVGYRAQKQGNKLLLTLGFSHPVEMVEPEGITYEVPAPNKIVIKGNDKQRVGEYAAIIRRKRPPEVYKGKGIKYVGEVIRIKEGKTGAKG